MKLKSSNRWNINSIPELKNKIILVTGANSGTGFWFTKLVAEKNATVIMACRNQEKGEKAKQLITNDVPTAKLDLEILDLADLNSVKDFSSRISNKYSNVDILCNNAGVMLAPELKTADNFDLTFATNHLGHFALTALLFNKISSDGRIITMSSNVHKYGNIHFNDINFEKKYGRFKAYSQSKLANLLFTYELDRKIREKQLSKMSLGAHPGWSATKLQTSGLSMKKGVGAKIKKFGLQFGNIFFAQSAEKGAHPLLMATTSEEVKSGDYIGPSGIGEWRGTPKITKSSKKSYNEDFAKKLWDISEEITGISFPVN